MPSNPTPAARVIDSVLALPAEDRLSVLEAIHASLADTSLDHGPNEPTERVRAAWSNEISRRLADIDSGAVKTISAETAEGMIRSDVKPSL